MLDTLIVIGIAAIAGVLSFAAGYFLRRQFAEAKMGSAEERAKEIVAEAQRAGEAERRELLINAKEEAHKMRAEADRENKERRLEMQRVERRLIQREEAIDRKTESIEKKENDLDKREKDVKKLEQDITEVYAKHRLELERISGLTSDQAKQELLREIETEIRHDAAIMIKDIEAQTKEEADKKARDIITQAIQRCAAEHVTETTVSVVPLPSDEMKGRIIGREGRNIRALETLTGVDLIIDDTPEAVILSSFDPVRREVARIALERLIQDGRIQPARIEEMVERAQKEIKKMDTFIHYAVAAAQMAADDAGLEIGDDNRERIGVYVGSGIGGIGGIEYYHSQLVEGGPRKVSPFFIPMVLINLASGQIAIRMGLEGPNSCAVTACATGVHCIGDAYHMVRRGDADVMLAGGAESAFTPLTVSGFAAARALSSRNDDPARASRPFDRDRDGFVLGEGAGVVVLETLEGAKARNATIYGEVLGYGLTGDAYHITAPPDDASGAVRCMRMALSNAGLAPEEVEHVSAHATSTFADKLETKALRTVFGAHADKIAVTALKSMMGHLLGAAGGVETAMAFMSLRHGMILPTINVDNPDPECDLDYVTEGARRRPVRTILKNSFGFGGTNASLVIARVD